MTARINAVELLDRDELLAFAEALQNDQSGEPAILSLTASADPAARERGVLSGLRAAMDGAIEPVPPNRHHSWGDWPHDLFADLQPHVAELKGIGIALFAWPGDRRHAIATRVHLGPAAYYLTRPVTFPLIAAAQTMAPFIAVELHRSSGRVRLLSGPDERSVEIIQRLEGGRVPNTGAQGMEHAERHAREVDSRHLANLAGQARSMPGAHAVVVAGPESMRKQFVRELNTHLPIADIEWDPDRTGSKGAAELALASAASRATNDRWVAQAATALATGNALTDWATVVAEANAGRLNEIWMDPASAMHRYVCGNCTNSVEGPGACPVCGTSPWDRLPLPEIVTRHAAETRAELHFVELAGVDGASTGIVATLRY